MRALAVLVPLVLLAPSALADHCTTWSTSNPELTVYDTNGDVQLYVDTDLCQPECAYSIWFYREYNGIPGLQRADFMRDDTCHGMIDPDGFEF